MRSLSAAKPTALADGPYLTEVGLGARAVPSVSKRCATVRSFLWLTTDSGATRRDVLAVGVAHTRFSRGICKLLEDVEY